MMTSPRIGWNVRPLRTLEAVARLGSVSAAARELGCTQSAASQHLAALERDAGVVLVDRGSRPLRPTPAGVAVLDIARTVLDGLTAMDALLAEMRDATRGTLRLAAFPGAVATFVPPAILELGRHHPHVSVEVATLEPDAAVASLRAGDVDMAVVHRAPGARPVDGLRRTGLLHDPMRVVVHEGHPLAGRRWIGVADLAGAPLIVPAASGPGHAHRALVERLFLDAGVTPEIAFEVDDLAAARALARSGLGAVLMYALTIPADEQGIVVRALRDGDAAARRVEVARVEGRDNPAADAMVNLLVTSYTGGD